MRLKISVAALALLVAAPSWAAGQHDGMAMDHMAMADTGAAIHPVMMSKIPNIPGKSLKSITVDYAPGGKSPAHRHAASAFVYAQVLSGAIRSQVEGKEAKVYAAGEYWTENPGDHHIVSENASATEPAKLLVVFVVDSTDGKLTTPDPQ